MNKEPMHHIEVNHLDEKKKASLANRILVGVGLAVVGIPCMTLGGWFLFVFIFLVACGAIYEVAHTTRKKYGWYVWVYTAFIVLLYIYWPLIKCNIAGYLEHGDKWAFQLESSYPTISASIFTIALSFGGFALFGIAHEDFLWNDIMFFFTMTLVVAMGMQSIMFLRYFPISNVGDQAVDNGFRFAASSILVWFVLVGTIFNDIWAYFVGMLFGKKKVNPRVSPNKTWAGFFGGWVLGGLSSLAFAMIFDACGCPLLPCMRVFGDTSQWWWVVVLCFFLPLIGDLGDFTFSFIKRHYEIKDFSNILGAHGGILDRCDSIIFCCIFSAIFVVLVNGGFNIFS